MTKISKHRTESQKLETVQTYLIFGGSVSKTAAAMKVPETTIYFWRKTDWWQEMEKTIRTEENLTLSARLKKILDKSMDIVEDRLENGDFIYDQKTGKMKRKPVAMKDAQKAVTEFMERREKLHRGDTHTVAEELVADKLAKLAAEFAKLARPQPVVTDVVFIKEHEENDLALDEEREEGLQT